MDKLNKSLKCNNFQNKISYIVNLLIIFILLYSSNLKKKENFIFNYSKEKDYNYLKFAIIQRKCKACGLFSFYIVFLGCIHKYLLDGFIPIIDIKSFPNVLNGFDISKVNAWEYFFEQPFGYTLEEVLKNAKNIVKIICDDCTPRPDPNPMFFNSNDKYFWHNFANKYSSIKKELILLSNKMRYALFHNSKNVLGVLTRGTDYISRKPKSHPIPPDILDLIQDVKMFDIKYNYDYIFFSTEDENIREQFSKNFVKKIRQLKPNIKLNYDYNKKNFLNFNENVKGNVEFNKIYLLNIILLSKCIDIITARCSGAAGIFILTNGFRNSKVYDLGEY